MSAVQYRSEWPRRGYFLRRQLPVGEVWEWISKPPSRWYFLRARLRLRLRRLAQRLCR